MLFLNTHRRDFLKVATVTLAGGLLASRASFASAASLETAKTKILTGEPLDATEIHHLEFIREEEKLARDVHINGMDGLYTLYSVDDGGQELRVYLQTLVQAG